VSVLNDEIVIISGNPPKAVRRGRRALIDDVTLASRIVTICWSTCQQVRGADSHPVAARQFV